MTKIKHLLLLVTLLFLTSDLNAQFTIKNAEEIEKVKSGTTYFALNDLDSFSCKEYINVIKKYWTISKVEFIKYSDVEENLAPGNSFFTLDGYIFNNGLFVDLNLLTPEKNYFEKKKKKKFTNDDKTQIARVELFPDYYAWMNPDSIYNYNCDLGKHFYNWRPGILKNQIQKLMFELQNATGDKSTTKAFTDKEKLKELKTQTLYVPDNVRLDYPRFKGEPGKQDEKEIFKKYPYKYEVISIDELSDKILNESNAFYYLQYIKINIDKYITIVNSQTGEIIYSRYILVSQDVSAGDIITISNMMK